MEEGAFGHHAVRVSRLGLGCSKLSPVSSPMRFDSARAVVDRAIDRGITFFDTADSYGLGWSERWLGRALGSRRPKVMIATKCGLPASLSAKLLDRFVRLKAGARRDRSPLLVSGYIQAALSRSLHRLRTDYVDVLMLHSPSQEVLSEGSWVRELQLLRERGVVRFFGISVRYPRDAEQVILEYDVDCVEIEVNPCTLEQVVPVISLAKNRGVAVIARQVLGSGKLLPAIHAQLKQNDPGIPISAVAKALIRSTMKISGVDVTLVGMRTERHVDENTAPLGLPYELTARIQEAGTILCAQARARG